MNILKKIKKDKKEDVVENSVSFFNIRIDPLKLSTDTCVDVKNNIDRILGPRLNDPDIAEIANLYSDAFERLTNIVYEGDRLKKEKESMYNDSESEAFAQISKDRETREEEYFKEVNKTNVATRKIRLKGDLKNAEVVYEVNGYKRNWKLDKAENKYNKKKSKLRSQST